MKILALDDEKPALSVLEKSINQAIPDAEVVCFGLPQMALEYLKANPVDVVFSDFAMPMLNGIEFGKEVKKINPKIDIVFVTGFGEYAIDTVNSLAPKGYIVKPVSKSKIEAVLSNLHTCEETSKGLYIKVFGNFEVFYNGSPVEFKNKKSKELLAYLIDRGTSCTRSELTAALYEDREESNAIRYLTDAVKTLSDTFTSLSLNDVFIRKFNSYYVDSTKFNSDLLEYKKGNINAFAGEYMTQYSWAEYKLSTFLK